MNVKEVCNAEPRTVIGRSYLSRAIKAMESLMDLSNREQVRVVNAIRLALHEYSPFHSEPVDCVLWVPVDYVEANDYNPNVVATPEMELLERSIVEDGYTQPVVTWVEQNGRLRREVIDGFHRRKVGVESKKVRKRCHGYLPVTTVNEERVDRGDRIAATIRHNRARGKHQVTAMSDIVIELKRRNWSDARVGKELGMDPDEVLRLTQISGMADMFSDVEFSEAWEPDTEENIEDINLMEESVDLEWYSAPLPNDGVLGWVDRTELGSICYGDSPKVLGNVQKSKVKDHWHWYAYTQPMKSGIADTRELAKCKVDEWWKDHG